MKSLTKYLFLGCLLFTLFFTTLPAGYSACVDVSYSSCSAGSTTQVVCDSSTWSATTYTTRTDYVVSQYICGQEGGEWFDFGPGGSYCIYCQACTSSTYNCNSGDRCFSNGERYLKAGLCSQGQYDATGNACSTGSNYKECCASAGLTTSVAGPQNSDGSYPCTCGGYYLIDGVHIASPGACPAPSPVCGDNVCNGAETCSSCPGDCTTGCTPPPPPGGTCVIDSAHYDGPYCAGGTCGGQYFDSYCGSSNNQGCPGYGSGGSTSNIGCIRVSSADASCNTGCSGGCGNGVIGGTENCDDGNTINGDGCSSTCKIEGCCGNGVCEASAGENSGTCLVDCPCTCTVWTSGSCAAGGCSQGYRQSTRTCSGTPACGMTSQCVRDASCPVCTINSWVAGSCGAGGCPSTYRQYTRTYSGCSPPPTTSQCIPDATCIPPPPPCSGTITLTLMPSTTQPSGAVSPYAGGLTSCNTQTIYFKQGSCSGATVSTCLSSGIGCTGPSFTAPSATASYNYYACIDKNADGDTNDAGEQGLATLNVVTTCAGTLYLALNPSTSGPSSPVSMYGGGLGSCDGKTITFKRDSCGSTTTITTCTVSRTGCIGSSQLTAPAAVGYSNYSACVDENGDGDTNDAGENATAILRVATCTGTLSMTLSPSSVTASGTTTPNSFGLSGCSGQVIYKTNTCAGTQVSNCSSTGAGCSGPSFSAPSLAGTYNYAACFDINTDGDFADAGENATAPLTVFYNCSGEISLTLTPNNAPPIATNITPGASNLAQCFGKRIEYRSDTCSGTLVSNCTSGDTGCTGFNFTSPIANNTYTYAACIDKNSDGDFSDAGENNTAQLIVAPPCSSTNNCDSCLALPNGQSCQCGVECASGLCIALGDTCGDCTRDSDCQSPPDECHIQQGRCVLNVCIYDDKTTNRPSCCSCTGGAQCTSGTCTGNVCSGGSCSSGGGDKCTLINPLDNCGATNCPACVVGDVMAYTGSTLSSNQVSYDNGARLNTSDASGHYSFYNISIGTHTLASSPTSQYTSTLLTRSLHRAINVVNLIAGTGSSDCTEACTLVGGTTCIASCDGTNGCAFHNATTKATCDGLQKGFIRNIDSKTEIVCCDGSPTPSISIPATAFVNASNAVTITRTVFYAGKLIKMKIVVFR